MEIVNKPWGQEIWLELNEKYCFKRILLKAGKRTSLQYHTMKLESSYVISGEGELWLESEEGGLKKKMLKAEDYFTIPSGKKHRVVAVTDLLYLETSTPEVDDTIRIEDDSSRENGKIESEHQQVDSRHISEITLK